MKFYRTFLLGFSLWLLSFSAVAAISLNVHFSGVRGAAKTNVGEILKNLQGALKYPLTQNEVMNFYRQAPRRIKEALQPYGYFRPTISRQLTHIKDEWTAEFTINPGPVMRVTKLDILISGAGKDDHAFHRLLKKFPIKVGEPLNAKAYDEAKLALANLASDRGYFKAMMERSHITINMRRYTATIELQFATGPRYKFGKTLFGHSPFALAFLRRYLVYRQGEPYSAKKMQETQQNLSNSGYFVQVAFSPLPRQPTTAKCQLACT